MHAMFKAMGIQDASAEEAWAAVEAADKEKDVDDIKKVRTLIVFSPTLLHADHVF